MADTQARSSNPEAGFTLLELSVSLLITVTILIGTLSLFDFSSRLARVQTNVSDMQQALRVSLQDTVRTVRMAGRGGMPMGAVPTGMSVSVRNNVPAGARIGGGATPRILEGSDVLTVRGVFSSPIWQVNSTNPASFTVNASSGVIQIATTTPTGIPQDLSALRAAVLAGAPEPLIVVSPRDAAMYAVVQLDPSTSDVNSNPDLYTVGFKITGGSFTTQYVGMSSGGVYPAGLTNAAFVGLLEEYRYYVREERDIPSDPNSDLSPRFSRARVFPGTENPYRLDSDPTVLNDAHPSWRQDIADNIMDMQLAMGFDSTLGGGAMTDDEGDTGDDDRIFESADGQNDDWLYNDAQAFNPATWNGRSLYFIRLSLLARTDRRDPKHEAPRVTWIEDHNLTSGRLNLRTERMYRRRLLQTVIDMRNIG